MEDDDELIVGGELVLSGYVGDDYWGDGFTYAGVVRALATLGAGPVTVRLNSGGGIATDGQAIYAALKGHPGRVTIRIEGVAASAASLIAMAGDEVVMSLGAMMMIHDPSGIVWGTAEDHQKSADMLDKLADNYAAVYAGRCGKSPDEVREMMRAEVWLTAAEAVEQGFADRVEEDAEAGLKAVAAFDFKVYAHAPRELVRMSEEKGWTFQPEKRTAPVHHKENVMPDDPKPVAKAPAAPVPASPQAQAPTMSAAEISAATAKAAADAVAVERQRAAGIREIVAKAKIPVEARAKLEAELIDEGATLDKARERVIDAWASCGDPVEDSAPRPTARIVSDADQRRLDAMAGALGATLFGGALEGAAAEYRGLTLKKLAMHLSGGSRFGVSDHEAVRAGMRARGVLMAGGMHSTSDFTYLTTEVMNRQLRAAYAARPGSWRRISRQRTATDFRTLYSVQAGADVEMRKVKENGEYESTVLSDTGESYRVERYGREVHITFESIVNDDLGAFTRLPQDFVRGCLNLESRIAWGIITANAAMSDGTALFATAAARKNLAGSGGAISPTTVGAARKAMWEQRPHGAKATGDDFISAVPDLLVVPPALDLPANQFVTATTPATDGNTNPYKATLEPIIEPRIGGAVSGGSDAAWYLFDSSMPVLEHAFLQGYEAPMVTAEDHVSPKGVTLTAEHIFGAGAVEFRGAYKNPGA